MTQKNLKPQQAPPVQREINTTSSADGTGMMTPLLNGVDVGEYAPFAGDDAE